MNKFILIMLASLVMAGCEEKEKGPDYDDVTNIVIDGQKYKAQQYVKKFCQFPKADEDKNCFVAQKQSNKEMVEYKQVKW